MPLEPKKGLVALSLPSYDPLMMLVHRHGTNSVKIPSAIRHPLWEKKVLAAVWLFSVLLSSVVVNQSSIICFERKLAPALRLRCAALFLLLGCLGRLASRGPREDGVVLCSWVVAMREMDDYGRKPCPISPVPMMMTHVGVISLETPSWSLHLCLILVFSLRVKTQILADRATMTHLRHPLLGGVALETLTCAGSHFLLLVVVTTLVDLPLKMFVQGLRCGLGPEPTTPYVLQLSEDIDIKLWTSFSLLSCLVWFSL